MTDTKSAERRAFESHVQAFGNAYRRRLLIRWALMVVVYGLLSFVLLLLAGVLSGFSFGGLNTAAFLVLVGAVFLFGMMLQTVVSGHIKNQRILQRWEEELRDTFDRLSTAQEMMDRPQEMKRLGYSPELVAQTIQFADDYVTRLIEEERKRPPVDVPLALITGFVLFGTLALVGLPAGRASLERLSASIDRLWRQPSDEIAGRMVLTVPERVARGSSVDLSVSAPPGPQAATLHVERRGTWERIALDLGRDGKAAYVLANVRDRVVCMATAGDLASNRRVIQPVDPPALSELNWRVSPPTYTRLPEQTHKGSLSGIDIPLGSELRAEIRADQPLASASWHLGKQKISLEIEGAVAKGATSVLSASPVVFEIANDLGMTTRSATETITIIPDQSPRAKIITPEQTKVLDSSGRQLISSLAQDDYGVQRVVLCYEVNYKEAQRAAVELWEASEGVESVTQTVVDFEWNLAPFNLFPGDEVSYYVEVWDNDPFANSKSGRSSTQILRYPSLTDVYQDLFEEETEQVDTMAAITEEQHSITEEVHEIARSIREKTAQEKADEGEESSLFAEQRRLEDLKERQESLQEELSALEEEIGKVTEPEKAEIEEQAGFSPETLAKIERIRELMSEMMSNEGRALLDQLDQMVEQMSEQVDPSELEQLEFSFEDFEQQLDRTLSQLESAYELRQLEGLWNVAEHLADREDRLERDTQKLEEQLQQENLDPETEQQLEREKAALQDRQKALNQDAAAMMEAMERLAEKLTGENPQLADQLQNMAESARREASQSLQQAEQQLSQGNLAEAQKSMNNAQNKLRNLAKELQDSFSGMGGISLQMDMQRIMRIVDRSLFLSERQEQLVDSPLAARQPKRSLEKEVFYAQEARRVAEEWTELLSTNPFIDVSVIAFLNAAAGGMRKAVDASESEEWIGYGPAHAALRNINEAISRMLSSMNSLQQQAAQGSAESFMQQMQQLIQQQQRLNEQTDRLRGEQQRGQDFLSQLQRMAQQQAMIRREIQKLMQRYRHMRNLQSRLDEVAKEMEEVEKQLSDAQLDRELDEKQDRILTRMLEAQTSQEQDTYGKRRKAEQPTGTEGADTPPDTVETGTEEQTRDIYESAGTRGVPTRYRDYVKRYFRNLRERESL